MKDDTGLNTFLNEIQGNLQFLDLSATAMFGSFLKNEKLSCLKYLYLDFCQKLSTLEGIENLKDLKVISTFGSDVEICKENLPKFCAVTKHSGSESEKQMRDFASKRNIKLTNWAITKKHLVSGKELMLSQIYLTSKE